VFFKARARKKKGLKSQIEIIPFKGQSLRKKGVGSKEVKPDNEQKIQELKPVQPEIKTLVQPTKTAAPPLISIKELKEKFSEKEIITKDHLPKTPFTREQLIMKWQQFAYTLKESGHETFHHAMLKREPILNQDFVVDFFVDNEIIYENLQPTMNDLLDNLQRELNNFSIKLHLQVESNETINTTNKPVTSKDRFQILAKRNPNLLTLKNLFNLDIEP
jgi:DNA polymerase III subunit gamma/tau